LGRILRPKPNPTVSTYHEDDNDDDSDDDDDDSDDEWGNKNDYAA